MVHTQPITEYDDTLAYRRQLVFPSWNLEMSTLLKAAYGALLLHA
jgi:hypothetical protein